MKRLLLFGLIFVGLLLFGCTSNPQTPPAPSQTSTVPEVSVAPTQQNQVGMQVTPTPAAQTQVKPRQVVELAKQHFDAATFQIQYAPVTLFGTTKSGVEAKSGKFLSKASYKTDYSSYEAYFDGTNWYECNTNRLSAPAAQAGKVIIKCSLSETGSAPTSDAANYLLNAEKAGGILTFDPDVTSGNINGRGCDQIKVSLDTKNIVGKTIYTDGTETICFDRDLGVALYLKATGNTAMGPLQFEIQFEKLTNQVDENYFALPKNSLLPGCGAENQACCSNTACDEQTLCSNNKCVTCGTDGNPCCENNTCNYNEQCLNGICHLG